MGGGTASGVFGKRGARHPRLAGMAVRGAGPLVRRLLASRGVVAFDSAYSRARLRRLEEAIQSGREAYLLGLGIGFHNSGAALVRVTPSGTVELICNEEEERYTGIKHCTDYPHHSIAAVRQRLDELGVAPADLAACVSSWEYARAMVAFTVQPAFEEAPASLSPRMMEHTEQIMSKQIVGLMRTSAARLGDQLGCGERIPIVGVSHHDCHAHFSYAVSPFAGEPGPTLAIVLDGSGDDAASSVYVAREDSLTRLQSQGSAVDSLGMLYGMLSSSQGGWPMLSSEGRYMGAAAWGNDDRVTNRHYRRLREIVHLGREGEVSLNRALINWPRGGWSRPYTPELADILGDPIPPERMWHPDRVLDVEDVRHPEVTRDRVDKAAALQMVFEDALAHIVEYGIELTGSHRLVLSGGTALNCVANMRLLDRFDRDWYERHHGSVNGGLQLWVPPVPGDAGAPAGAAYTFAMRAGAAPGRPLRHAFYCGAPPSAEGIRTALAAEPKAGDMALGDCSDPATRAQVADLLAHCLSGDRVVGLFQGASETGPRALGHRSILANPCNPETRRVLNERVKHRELIRPLAPMVTRAAAERLFELQPGAAADDYDAYNYMVLTARARPEARQLVPAVVHHDGTGRLQIVRPESDPFCHEFLLAMGRRVGVEASVNTSLNVGAPIAHTPAQAVETLKRAKGMDGLLMIDAKGQATLVLLNDRPEAKQRLLDSVRAWSAETNTELPTLVA